MTPTCHRCGMALDPGEDPRACDWCRNAERMGAAAVRELDVRAMIQQPPSHPGQCGTCHWWTVKPWLVVVDTGAVQGGFCRMTVRGCTAGTESCGQHQERMR